MRYALALLCLSFAACAEAQTKYVPTPEMAVKFAMGEDARKWVPQHMDGDRNGIIFELVPEGDSIKSWKEMVAQQIVFIESPLRSYVDAWKAGLTKADPKAKLAEEILGDGSILVRYESESAAEIGVRRFMKAKDGVYMLAYHVRPQAKTEANYSTWEKIVRGSSLVPNPKKKGR